jgi:hypothetical protein
MVMIQRMFLVLLLLSSHAFALRSAMDVYTSHNAPVMTEPCCPLCVPGVGGSESNACGCGCGDADQNNQIPASPEDLPAVVSGERWIPGPTPELIRVAYTAERTWRSDASLSDDAIGHAQTKRFLARVGVWRN